MCNATYYGQRAIGRGPAVLLSLNNNKTIIVLDDKTLAGGVRDDDSLFVVTGGARGTHARIGKHFLFYSD